MALEVTPVEAQRWEEHLKNSAAHATHGGGVGANTPEHVKELIVQDYKNGSSLRQIRRDRSVGIDIVRDVLKRAGLRS